MPASDRAAVPFDPSIDTDGDGLADTALTDDGVDLLFTTDLDGDGLADQIVHIGPDGVPREVRPPHGVVLGVLLSALDALDGPAEPR